MCYICVFGCGRGKPYMKGGFNKYLFCPPEGDTLCMAWQ